MHTIRYFQSVLTKEYFVDRQLVIMKSITGDTLDDMVKKDMLVEVKEPTVEQIIAVNGKRNLYPAVVRYKDLNKCQTSEANEIVFKKAQAMTGTKAKVFEKEGK